MAKPSLEIFQEIRKSPERKKKTNPEKELPNRIHTVTQQPRLVSEFEASWLQSMGPQRVVHNWATNTFTFFDFILKEKGITDFEARRSAA